MCSLRARREDDILRAMIELPLGDVRSARRTIRTFALATLLGLIPLWTVNTIVDPLDRHSWQFVPGIVQRSRAAKVELLERYQGPMAGLVLGSSRAQKVEPAYIEPYAGGPVFNASVNSARAEDYLAMTRFVVEGLGKRPSLIVIGLDVEAFTPAVGVDERLLQTPQLITRLPGRTHRAGLLGITRLFDDLSWETTRATVASLTTPPAERQQRGDRVTFAADGFATFGNDEDAVRAGTFDLQAGMPDDIAEYRGRFAGFDRLDPQRVTEFEETLRLAQSIGARVDVFLTTLHPQLLADLRRVTAFDARHEEVVALVDDLRAQGLIDRFYDATEVASYGGDAELFYDGAHTREENLRRILDALLRT